MRNNSLKHSTLIIGLIASVLSILSCEDTAVKEVNNFEQQSEIYQLSRMIGEGHNYVLEKLIQHKENGLDWEIVKNETEKFYRSKGLEVEVPSSPPIFVANKFDQYNKPNNRFYKITDTESAVSLLDSFISDIEADIPGEWIEHFQNIAERMDMGDDIDSYIDSIETEDSFLIAHLWFTDAVYDSSSAYWDSYFSASGTVSKGHYTYWLLMQSRGL